jgi:hypothetical protein
MLLNVSYKILLKALALLLCFILPQVIWSDQTGFVQGRFILDNMVAIWKGMKWARYLGLKGLFIKLDFRKAYDWVEWSFILAKFQALGFGQFFIWVVETLFANALACISVNQAKSEKVRSSKSISQAFPLAPTLHFLDVESRGYLLHYQSTQGLIIGIPFLGLTLENG